MISRKCVHNSSLLCGDPNSKVPCGGCGKDFGFWSCLWSWEFRREWRFVHLLENLDLTLRNYSKYHIDMTVQGVGKQPRCLTCLYGEANRSLLHLTRNMIKFLIRLIQTFHGWTLGTSMKFCDERSRWDQNDRDASQIQAFRDVVDICGLCDLGFNDREWTSQLHFHRQPDKDIIRPTQKPLGKVCPMPYKTYFFGANQATGEINNLF